MSQRTDAHEVYNLPALALAVIQELGQLKTDGEELGSALSEGALGQLVRQLRLAAHEQAAREGAGR